MKTFQELILQEIESTALMYGLGCTQSAAFSNTGTVNLHPEGSVQVVARVSYDFQPDTYTLRFFIGSQPPRDDYFSFYQANHGPTKFWNVLQRELKALKEGADG